MRSVQAAAQSATETIDSQPSPGMSRDPAQVRRLRSFLNWMVPILLVFVPFDFGLYLLFGDASAGAIGLIVLGLASVLWLARRRIHQGRLPAAVAITAGAVLVVANAIAWFRPALMPVLVWGSVLSVAIVLPFLHRSSLRWFLGIAFGSAISIVLAGSYPVFDVPNRLPLYVQTGVNAVALIAVTGLVLLMLGHFSSRLSEIVEETRRANHGLVQSQEDLKRVHASRSRFVNMTAHEIATPLTPIRLQLHNLRKNHSDNLTARQRASLDTIDRNFVRLSGIVGDLLDTTRIENGKLAIERRAVEINHVALEAAMSFESLAQANGVQFHFVPCASAHVIGDERRLGQVLFNLLTNAFKFTPKGGTVFLQLEDAGKEVRIRVIDDGIGIEPADQERLFEPFSQVDSSSTARGGIGLGLFVARGIVEAHGGRIWSQSRGRGHGSTFHVSLPKSLSGATATADVDESTPRFVEPAAATTLA